MKENQKYKNGQLKYVLNENHLTYFYINGITKAEGSYVLGLMEGQWIFYRKNAQLWQAGHFTRGIKNGLWIRYDKNNEIEYQENFNNGKPIKTNARVKE